MAHHFILDVYDSPNRKYVNLSIIYHIADFNFFMSQHDAYFHIHQNDPRSKGEMQWIGCIEVISLIAGPIKQRETEYNTFC